jgi:MoaA/NifB/PqqE/SkfB family radical SAM enzyme
MAETTAAAQGRFAAPTRTLQIHVTRRCNLKCLHCYSSSGPDAREALSPELLRAALTDARSLGFGFATLSGGEPFLYAPMAQVLGHAKALGMRAGVVTNGMYLDARRLAPLQSILDLLVVSLDGAPDRHNRMRAHPRAFQTMADKLPELRASGVPFGFLMTLTRDNIDDLDWVAGFAADAGAAMLQIHPLDLTGRAAETAALADAAPDAEAAVEAAYRAAALQRRMQGRMRVVIDFQPRLPQDGAAPLGVCDGARARFSDLAAPLCVETDGTIVPMGFGFSRDFAVGRLGDAPLRAMAQAWMEDGRAARYRRLIETTRARMRAEDAPRLSNLAHAYRRASWSSGAAHDAA